MTKTKARYTIPPQLFTPRFDFVEAFYIDEEIRRLLLVSIHRDSDTGACYGGIVPAIRYYRQMTGASLVESKNYVEKIRDAIDAIDDKEFRNNYDKALGR